MFERGRSSGESRRSAISIQASSVEGPRMPRVSPAYTFRICAAALQWPVEFEGASRCFLASDPAVNLVGRPSGQADVPGG